MSAGSETDAERRLIAPGLVTRVVAPASVEPAEEYRSTLAADFADVYRRGADMWTGEDAMRETPRILVDALGGDVRGRAVLDIGCGRGIDVAMLAEAGATATGVDLVRADEWDAITGRLPGTRFHAGDLVDLVADGEIPAGGLDAVMDNGCMHHQHPDRVAPFLESIRTILRPDGRFVVSVFGAGDEGGRWMHNDARRLFRDFTEAELVELARGAGFTDGSVTRVERAADLVYLVGVFRPDPAAA